jgi:hypothetical protein
MSEHQADEPWGLLTLPDEIRNKIWLHWISSPSEVKFRAAGTPTSDRAKEAWQTDHSANSKALLLANKQVRHEVLGLYRDILPALRMPRVEGYFDLPALDLTGVRRLTIPASYCVFNQADIRQPRFDKAALMSLPRLEQVTYLCNRSLAGNFSGVLVRSSLPALHVLFGVTGCRNWKAEVFDARLSSLLLTAAWKKVAGDDLLDRLKDLSTLWPVNASGAEIKVLVKVGIYEDAKGSNKQPLMVCHCLYFTRNSH